MSNSSTEPPTPTPDRVGRRVDRILLGVDSSVASDSARTWAEAIARAFGAELVTVPIEDAVRPWAGVGEFDRNTIRLLGRAPRGDRDLVVLGRPEPSGRLPTRLPARVNGMLDGIECPIAIIPEGTMFDPSRGVVVGIRGVAIEQPPTDAIDFALMLASQTETSLTVAHLADASETPDPVTVVFSEGQGPQFGPSTALSKLVGRLVNDNATPVYEVSAVGRAGQSLVDLSSDTAALVVGDVRSTSARQHLHASPSRYCAAWARCPVVLVPVEPHR